MVASFVVKQKTELAGFDLESIPVDSRKLLLADFRGSAAFGEDYSTLINIMSLPRSEDQLTEIRRGFSGLFFEDMGYRYWSGVMARSGGALTLLSPQNTFQVYRRFFPYVSESEHPVTGRNSLYGIIVPDGILADSDGHVHAVLEYSVYGGWQYFGDKLRGFTAIKDTPRLNDVFGGSQLIFVTPTFSENKPDADIREMPMRHKQFGDFVDYVFRGYRLDSDSATVAEVQQEAHRQFGKRRDLLFGREEHLTLEQRAYLEKVLRINPGLFISR